MPRRMWREDSSDEVTVFKMIGIIVDCQEEMEAANFDCQEEMGAEN